MGTMCDHVETVLVHMVLDDGARHRARMMSKQIKTKW